MARLDAPSFTPSAPSGPPAGNRSVVVDLDAVAKAMGWDAVITKRVELATQNLNAQLIQAAENLEKELKQLQADLGASPTEPQLARFQQSKLRVQQTVQSNKTLAEQARDAVRAEQILLFRKEIKPVAGLIAGERHAEVVLIANQDVVWYDPAADITGEVISRLRAKSNPVAAAGTSATPESADANLAPAVDASGNARTQPETKPGDRPAEPLPPG
jgi:Skp family chaperone for outer membrane proteins